MSNQTCEESSNQDESAEHLITQLVLSKPKHFTINLDAGTDVIINKPRKSEISQNIKTTLKDCNDKHGTQAHNDKNHNNLKKTLSFIRDEDDEEDIDETIESKAGQALSDSTNNNHNDVPSTNINPINEDVDNSKDNPFRKSSVDKVLTNGCCNLSTTKGSSTKNSFNDRKISSRIEERINSPNSLSGDDDHFSESLDYDEDSVKGSPQHINNGQKSSTIRQSISSDGPTKSSQSNSPSTNPSRFSTSDDLRYKLRNSKASPSSSNHLSTHALDQTDKPRIRSFISSNNDHDDSRKTSDEIMIVDDTTSNAQKKSYQETLRYFLKDACFFQIKSINHENVHISKNMGFWATSFQNESRFNAAFRENRNVILIFSVQQSGAFQGFARMISEAKPSSRAIPWVLPERLSNKSLGGLIEIDWLCTKELSFQDTSDLINSYNDNKPVKIARDGQQLEPKVGKKLCRLFPRDSFDRVQLALETLKRQASERKKTTRRYDNVYPNNDRRNTVYQHHPSDMDLAQIPMNGYPHNLNILSRIGFPKHQDQTHATFSPIIHHQTNFNSTDLAQSRGFRPNPRRRVHDQSNFPSTHPYYNPNFRQMRGFYPDNINRGPNGYYSRYTMPTNNDFNYPTFHAQNQMHFPNIVMDQAEIMHRNHPYQRNRR